MAETNKNPKNPMLNRPKSSQSAEKAEKIQGQIERITFQNEENGFTVAKMKVQGKKDLSHHHRKFARNQCRRNAGTLGRMG